MGIGILESREIAVVAGVADELFAVLPAELRELAGRTDDVFFILLMKQRHFSFSIHSGSS